jgi:predicted transcriptional regulator
LFFEKQVGTSQESLRYKGTTKRQLKNNRKGRKTNRKSIPRPETVLKILQVVIERGSLLVTPISQAANVQGSRLDRYLDLLKERGYITYDLNDKKAVIKITEAGIEFAAKLAELCPLESSLCSGEVL